MKNQLRCLIACAAVAASLHLNAVTFEFHNIGWPASFVEISPAAFSAGSGTAADILDFSLSSYLGFTLQKSDPDVTWSLSGAFSLDVDRSYLMEFNLVAYGLGGVPLFQAFYEPYTEWWAGGHELDGPWRHAAYSSDGANGGFTAGTWDRVPESGSSAGLMFLGLMGLTWIGRKPAFMSA